MTQSNYNLEDEINDLKKQFILYTDEIALLRNKLQVATGILDRISKLADLSAVAIYAELDAFTKKRPKTDSNSHWTVKS